MAGPLDLTRVPSTRRTKRSMLIVHGGGLAAEYLHYLKRRLEHGQLSLVRVDPEDGIEEALAETARQARRARLQGSAFDQAWCLSEDPSGEVHSELGKTRIVDCGPCIDRWILLHFEAVPPDTDPVEVRSRLAQHLPELAGRPRHSLGLLDGRYEHARRLDPPRNQPIASPADLVDSLIDSLAAFRGIPSSDIQP